MIRERGKQNSRLVLILIIVIVILLAILAYSFLIRPGINSYVVAKQTEAVEDVVNLMILQIQQQGYTQIGSQELNQSFILVPYNPQQAQTQPVQ